MKFGVLGCGKMGMSIVNGIIKNNVIDKNDIYLYDINLEEHTKNGYNTCSSEKELYETVDMLLLSVKPQVFESVLDKLKGVNGANIIITIAAGIKIAYIKSFLGEKEYVRVMPNTPALIGHAASAICFEGVSNKEVIFNIFNSIGVSKEIEESQMDDIIPANGSLPAYGYYFMEAFIDSSVKRGIDYEVAKELVCKTMIGSCEMILNSSKPISELINDVCSKGGTTIEGIYVFDKYNLKEIVDEACIKCVKRSIELGNR